MRHPYRGTVSTEDIDKILCLDMGHFMGFLDKDRLEIRYRTRK
jgi:hypothetical protein